MAITAKDVMALRQKTSMGMMECKEALNEAGGDFDAAVEILMKKAKGKMDLRTDRAAVEGALAVAKSDDAVVIVELNTETDFVARGDAFIEAAQNVADELLGGAAGEAEANDAVTAIIDEVRLTSKENASFARGFKFDVSGLKVGSYLHHNRQIGAVVVAEGDVDDDTLLGLAQHVSAHVPTPLAVDESGLPADLVEKNKTDAIAEAEASGKPAEIAEKIATGKLNKWINDNTLLGQSYVRDDKQTVKQALPAGVTVKGFVRYEVGVK
ncbi:MAG: translation elongation factor Ts [Planctomycetota bacterium]|jgi:elongation factor Ts